MSDFMEKIFGFILILILAMLGALLPLSLYFSFRGEMRKEKAYESCLKFKPAHECYDFKVMVD